MIRPVFASTATFTTHARLILRGGRGRVRLPVRCGLIRHPVHGPILIDAGCGPRVTQDPDRSVLLRLYNHLLGPVIHPASSPVALLAAHGYAPTDVTRVLLTHLHVDHVSDLHAFPQAELITDGPALTGLRHGVFAELLPADFHARQRQLRDFPKVELPFDLGTGFDLLGHGSVIGVPLPGHAAGHYGLCFPGERPLLYAVDAQWMLAGIMEDRIPGFPASLLALDRAALHSSVRLVRDFANAGGEVVLCHDPAPTPHDWVPDDV